VKDDRLYLIHIQECLARIERYTEPGRDAFLADSMVQDAVLRNLHTQSESTQRLSDAAKALQPAVDWASIAAFRNVVVHDYLGVDLERIWDIVERDLPSLMRTVAAIQAKRG
jgi:uncharacterized protein with HEPN domain